MKDMIVVVWFVKCNKGNVFVLSKLIITKNENSGKVNIKVSYNKKWTGFMGSLMHSLIKDMVDTGNN
jgi:hypothetical protein